jgi:tetratricopeptide (TPR) repeat protein
MEKLHFLLNSLSKPQIRMLKDYLHYFNVRKEPDTQLMKLAEIISSRPNEIPSLEDCSIVMYGEMNYNAIQKAKSRLQKKVENLILLDTGTEKRDQELDELDKAVFVVRRKVALYHILMARTSNNAFLSAEGDEIIRLSKKYELYAILIEQLKYKKWRVGLREGEKIFFEINAEIEFYERCNSALNKAVDAFSLAMIRAGHTNKAGKQAFLEFLRSQIAYLHKEVEATHAPTLRYYAKQLEMIYYDAGDEIQKAQQAVMEMLQILKANKSVFKKIRLATAYLFLANCDIRTGDYEKAVDHAVAAKKHFIRNSINYYASLEYEFVARFYQMDLVNSQRLSQELLRSVRQEQDAKQEIGDFLFARYLMYKAYVLFAQKKFKETLSLLNFKLSLTKDKQGWDLSIRILKIQALLELGRTDEAANQVVNLLKHTERSFSKDELKPRENLIIKSLRMLNHEGFSSARVKPKLEKIFTLFKEQKNCAWQSLSPELIPFEKWMASHYKIRKRSS